MENNIFKIEYIPHIRNNNPIYLLRQSYELVKIAIQHESPSSLIYACLECRIALEILELNIILVSVSVSEHNEIIEESKPKNGIEKINRKVGSLKQKYQLFFQAVCEVLSLESKYFDFNKSKELKDQLSSYIHSYALTDDELLFNSEIMQKSISLIKEVESFILKSVNIDDTQQEFSILGADIKRIPKEDQLLLSTWKTSTNMTYEELKFQLKANLKERMEK